MNEFGILRVKTMIQTYFETCLQKGTHDLKRKDLVSMYLHGTQTDLLAMVIYQFFCGIQCRTLLKFSWLLCLHSITAQGDYLQVPTTHSLLSS